MGQVRTSTPKKAFVTGGAGFIGSNLTERLLDLGWAVTVYDNLSLGQREFVAEFTANSRFRFVENDLLRMEMLIGAMAGHDIVFHLAANSDIGYGAQFTDVDLKQGTIATYNVLEAMRVSGVREIILASTSAIYGEPTEIPTPEDYGPLLPISLYGASKLACEGLVSAFCHNFDFRAWIFRFGNVVGPNVTHGVVYDFINKLRGNPNKLEILGDGNQSKPYLHARECIGGMLHGYSCSSDGVNIFNLACEGGTAVKTIADMVIAEMGLKGVKLEFTGGTRGWVGDVSYVRLDSSKIEKLGWKTQLTSDEAVRTAVRELLK